MAAAFRNVVVEVTKLRDYCLSDRHPRGRHKARTFRARLGLTASDAEALRRALLAAVSEHETTLRATEADAYGQRYILDFAMVTKVGRATIRSAWIVRTGEDVLRLTTCYVLPERS